MHYFFQAKLLMEKIILQGKIRNSQVTNKRTHSRRKRKVN